MIELLLIHTCRKRTQMRTQENENCFIPCVDACVCICVGVVHKSNSLHLHLRLHFEVIDWPREVWVLILLPSWKLILLFRAGPIQILHVLQIDVSAWNLRTSRINGWKVRKMLEFDVFRQWVTVLLKKTMYNQCLRFFKVYLETENWNEEKSRTSFCNSGEIKVQLAYTNTLLFHLDRETEFCCYRHWQPWQLAVIKIAIMI